MGDWISESYASNWNWAWFVCPQTYTLYQRNQHQWNTHTPITIRRTYAIYHETADSTHDNIPEQASPVTPTFHKDGIRIELPANPIHRQPTLRKQNPPLQIYQRLTTPTTKWEVKLWANIQIQTRIPDLYQQINTGRQVIIASDAAMNPNQDSSFAWLIATDQPIWQGEGAVPGPVEDAHTGRSEAYGILTAMRFLTHYLKHFPMIYHLTRTMIAYCDNSGTVSRIKSLLHEQPCLTHSTILDDYDVYEEIAQATQSLHPLRVKYLHIKGHQDKNQPVHKLSKPAQYNVNCDKRATATLPDLTPFSTRHKTQQMPASYPHLVIEKKVVVKDLQGALRHAAVTPVYRTYLQTKFHWTTSDAEEVNWNALTMTLKHFPKDHQRISKIIHEWLPLLGAHTPTPTANTQCPNCQQAHEDTWHFLECTAVARQKLFNQLHRDLQALHKRYHIDPYMFQLLWQGLLSIRMDIDITGQLSDYPTQYQTLYERQREIGWEQLYYGRIAVSWAHYIDTTTHGKTSGTIFYSRAIRIMWHYLLQVWTTRNTALHPPTPSEFSTAQLRQQVDHLLYTANRDPATKHLVEDVTSEQIMQLTPARIKQWLITGTSQIKIHIAAAHQRAKLQTTDIRNFFTRKASRDKDSLKPP